MRLLILLTAIGMSCAACDRAPVALHTGDSITVLSSYELQAQELRNGILLVNTAVSGFGLKDIEYWELANKAAFKSITPDVVIVTMGSNDANAFGPKALDPDPLDDYPDRIDRYLKSLPAGVAVYWFGVPSSFADSHPERSARAELINAYLYAAQDSEEWPNLTVVDADLFLGCDECRADLVHPSFEGSRRFAGWVIDEVAPGLLESVRTP